MIDGIKNLLLEYLKRFQVEQAVAREHDLEILSRLSSIESGIACLTRDSADTDGALFELSPQPTAVADAVQRHDNTTGAAA